MVGWPESVTAQSLVSQCLVNLHSENPMSLSIPFLLSFCLSSNDESKRQKIDQLRRYLTLSSVLSPTSILFQNSTPLNCNRLGRVLESGMNLCLAFKKSRYKAHSRQPNE